MARECDRGSAALDEQKWEEAPHGGERSYQSKIQVKRESAHPSILRHASARKHSAKSHPAPMLHRCGRFLSGMSQRKTPFNLSHQPVTDELSTLINQDEIPPSDGLPERPVAAWNEPITIPGSNSAGGPGPPRHAVEGILRGLPRTRKAEKRLQAGCP